MQHFLFSCLQGVRGDQWRRKAEGATAILQIKEDYCQEIVESCNTDVLRTCLGVTNLIHRLRRKRQQKGLSSSTVVV